MFQWIFHKYTKMFTALFTSIFETLLKLNMKYVTLKLAN